MNTEENAPGGADTEWTIDRLFEGRPASMALFGIVRGYIESLGPVLVGVTKTQVSFGAERKFAWVWLPQMWVRKRAEDSITVAFDLDRRVEDPRIAEAVEPRPGHWMHHVLIDTKADFDDDVKGWLREAYERGSIPTSRR